MSPRYEPADIDEVRERASIVEVISEHVRLRRTGRTWKGLCPFHQEKTPSFVVDAEKGVWYCHGCNQGGTVFTFVEMAEGLSFPEAVESVARRYAVPLREVVGGSKKPSPRAQLYALHEMAVERYAEFLAAPDASPVRSYLESRGITSELATRYRIGFGGWRRDVLVRALLRAGYEAEELVGAGLATRDQRGIRDTFYGRVLFPIFDPSGRCVGFGGRVLPDGHRPPGAPQAPKYLNSRETAIFRKSRLLYGTNWARADVLRTLRLVVVEGYTDVIALHAAGIGEAVATCGTALTEDHMKEISTRFGDVRVVLCLDADAAGLAAMSRERTEELAKAFAPGDDVGGAGWLPIGRGWLPEVHVATLPPGKDPADFVRAEGPEPVMAALDAAVPLVEFLLRRALEGADVRTPEGRARAVRRGLDVLRHVGDSIVRHEYALVLADRTGVDPYEVVRALDVSQRTERKGRGAGRPQAARALTGPERIEREALRALVAHPVLFDADATPDETDFTLSVHRALFRLARADYASHASVDPARVASRVREPELLRLLGEISVGETPDETVARDTVVRLKVVALERLIVERKGRLRGLDPVRDEEAYDALFEELLGLEKRKRSLGSQR